MQKIKNGFGPFGIIIIAVIALIAVGSVYVKEKLDYKRFEEMRVQMEKQLEIIKEKNSGRISGASWKIYQNKKYGFEISFPSELVVSEYPHNSSYPAMDIYRVDTLGPHPPPAEFSVDMIIFANPSNLNLQKWYMTSLNGKEFDYTDMAPKVIEPESNLQIVDINSSDTLKIETRMPYSSYWVKRYFLTSNSHVVEIRVADFVEGHSITGTKVGDLLDQVVASFKTTSR